MATAKASQGFRIPEGSGRRRVRSIRPSSSTSCHWFKAQAPWAMRRTPRETVRSPHCKRPLNNRNPVAAERVEREVILYLVSSRNAPRVITLGTSGLGDNPHYSSVLRYSMTSWSSSSEMGIGGVAGG